MSGGEGSNRKLWDKGYKISSLVEKFTVGNDYLVDMVLVKYDCLATIAHARMLHKVGIYSEDELSRITDELNNIIKLSESGKFEITPEQEDCHTAIENYLVAKVGEAGKKIHMYRSRNDQVLTALRLYYKDKLKEIVKQIENFQMVLKDFRRKFGRIRIPGYTHTRKAMPTTVEMWAECWIDSMKDNKRRLLSTLDLIDQSPLGAGAGYGLPAKINRGFTARLLNFKRIQKNPIYCMNSRGKFEADIIHTLSLISFDLNKLATDIIFYSMPEIGVFILEKSICTGSSIMPHKTNPDVFEVMRANHHVINSLEQQVKNISSNLISGYHRDFQLQKEAIIKSFHIVLTSLEVATHVFQFVKVDRKRAKKLLTDELFSVEEAYKLSMEKGIPFREAYSIITKKYCCK